MGFFSLFFASLPVCLFLTVSCAREISRREGRILFISEF